MPHDTEHGIHRDTCYIHLTDEQVNKEYNFFVTNPIADESIEEYNYIDPLNGWQHKLLAYLVKEKPEIMKKLVDGELEALEPTYLSKEQEILLNVMEEEEVNEAELPVLSTHTDIPKSITKAKHSKE
ncbi:hypothetical protein CIHG_04450 [Coccidioides immitis H538.4]|uniref:Uncharacterized protein n=1 Tax=Coccidioides immitis H538.4 TaxID=396776 RepID=A0A0J8RPY1_COCIT|nr:hypothetical protein CIHG_04450 [Coccidioides immitis H538.4]